MSTKIDHSTNKTEVTRKELIRLVWIFSIWRAALFLIAAVASNFLAYKPSFPYSETILAPTGLPQWFYSWANFDGVHYITIAEKGYVGTGLIQAFFPFFPAVLLRSIYLLSDGRVNLIVSGLLITNLATLLACVLWFTFLKTMFKEKLAYFGVVLLLVFPTSLFFGAFYTESIFFAAVIGAFLLARKQRWLLAGLVTIIATSTRVVGVFLLPALATELWLQWRSTQTTQSLSLSLGEQLKSFLFLNWRKLLFISIGALGILGYMAYLAKTFGDALYFLHVQSEFGAGRTEGFVIYPQVLWRSIKILLTNQPATLRYYTYVLEFLAGSLGLVGMLLSALKVRLSYVIFALGAFFMPTFTGTFSSMPRYILICFPLYLLVIEWLANRPRVRAIVLVLCSLVLIVNTIIFIQGYWLS